MKGILLGGGRGTRFGPCSLAVNKHLFPVYDQPVIYHPLAMLVRAGIRDITLVTAPGHLPAFQSLLGDGSAFGIRLGYVAQPSAAGIADAVRLCRSQVGGHRFCVALGDNLFPGNAIDEPLHRALKSDEAVIFASRSDTPKEFGVVEIGDNGRALSIEEKPDQPRSDWVIPGLYVYPPDCFDLLDRLSPSQRGELEVSALNQLWLEHGRLRVEKLSSDVPWLDLGTPERLLQASILLSDSMVVSGYPEAAAWRQGWLGRADLLRRAKQLTDSVYGETLYRLANEEEPPG